MSSRAQKLDESANKAWEKDSEASGLKGLSIEDAVAAVMYNPATATLPDPLKLPSGAPLDKDSWLVQAEAAGLFIDEEDLQLLAVEAGDGSGLAVIKEEPRDPDAEELLEVEEPEEQPEPEAGPSESPAKRSRSQAKVNFLSCFDVRCAIFRSSFDLYNYVSFSWTMRGSGPNRSGLYLRGSASYAGAFPSSRTR